MNWNLDDLPLFVAVCDHMNITAAADELGLAKSTISKALTRLEQGIGVRLLERNSRNIRITSEGRVFLEQARLILEQVNEADATMAGLVSEPAGPLVVALPMAFAREIVAPRLRRFYERFPAIELEIVITSHPVDVIRDRIDLAVQVGHLDDSELIARRLYESRLCWVTTPGYLASHGLNGGIESLVPHIRICEKRYGIERFPVRVNGEKRQLDLSRGIIHVNDPIAVRESVLNGLGVTLLPDQYCKRHLDRGELVQVFKHVEFEASASVLTAVYPSRRLLSNKTRAFLEFLVEICEGM
jgi:DNA-binding transcriptional LysR family regulator